MYDSSMLPVEGNIINILEATKATHAVGASVEAELGLVGFAPNVNDQSDEDTCTRPELRNYLHNKMQTSKL